MKRLSLFVMILAALMLACNITGGDTPIPATPNPPQPSDTPGLQETPTVTMTPTVQANVQCNELSFFLDPAVAATYACETVPENLEVEPWQTPQYTSVTLEGYVLDRKSVV
jgi:hypothetical protein